MSPIAYVAVRVNIYASINLYDAYRESKWQIMLRRLYKIKVVRKKLI